MHSHAHAWLPVHVNHGIRLLYSLPLLSVLSKLRLTMRIEKPGTTHNPAS